MDLSNNYAFQTLVRTLDDYSDNMSDYNSNMRHLINSMNRFIDLQLDSEPLLHNTDRVNRNSIPNGTNIFQQPSVPHNQRPLGLGYNLFNQPYFRQPIQRPIQRHFQDVVIRPTYEQIMNACHFYLHDNTMPVSTCPISLSPFVEGDEICRINYCSHIFKKESIMEWFNTSVRCPVCRYDIRDYVDISNNTQLNNENTEENSNETSSNPPSSTSSTSNIPNTNFNPYRNGTNVINRFGESLENFLTNELNNIDVDNSIGQLLYSFDIPIISNNITHNTTPNTSVIINDVLDISYNNTSDISYNNSF